tara:strand:- start:2771 stop:5140 length:2370 start_codon:yes stop_codon:yes gene_type:complete
MATTTPSNLDKEINEGILRTYLGVEDASDIDFETYRTLLKEKIAAARMGGSKMDSGDISYLTNEFLRIRKFKVPEGKKKKKIDVKKFVQKTEETRKKSERLNNKFLESKKVTPSAAPSKSVKPQMLMLPPAQSPLGGGEDDQEFKEQVSKGLENIVPNLDTLQSTMESILGTLKQQALLDKKEEREEDKLEAKEKRVSREKALESKGKKTGVDDKNLGKKAVKPVKGIFDMLMDFFKNVLLGGALLFLLNVLKDPKKMLQPLVDALNNVLGFFNGIIRGINGFIDGFNKFVFGPINNFVLNPIHSSLNFIEDRINDVLGLFGADPLENIPDESPALEIPKIPEIPMYDPFKIRPENQEQAPPVQTFSGGGQVTNNSINITGAGADTQLIAAQPGEFVMSRGAVNKYGADTLADMNAAGGGTNKPRDNRGIQGFSNGGLVGGTAGNPPNAKKRKIFFHWTGGYHNQNVGPYHQVFDGSGKPMRTASYGVDNNDGTGGYNGNSVAIAAAAMGHKGMTPKYYSDAKGWKENPLTNAQTNAMAKEAAALMKSYGQTASDVDKNVFTHGEIERKGVRDGKLSSPVQRWDLDSLTPGPYNHPGGFFSTQQVKSTGGNAMRSKIKQFLGSSTANDASSDQNLMPSTTPKVKLEGVSDVNKSVFDSMSERQRSRVLSASVGTNVEGINVTENIQQQLRKYETAQVQLGSLIKSPVETGSAPVTSPTVKPKPRREAPGPRPKSSGNTVIQNSQSKVPANATPMSAASGGPQNTVPNFSSTDSMNTETLIIKSIYSLVI